MSDHAPLRKGLKEQFKKDLTPSEKIFFLKKAEEAILRKGYPADEDLFYYCYFLTLQERMRAISPPGSEGYLRLLLVEGKKDIEESVRMYGERLEKKKLPVPDPAGIEFIEYFSG